MRRVRQNITGAMFHVQQQVLGVSGMGCYFKRVIALMFLVRAMVELTEFLTKVGAKPTGKKYSGKIPVLKGFMLGTGVPITGSAVGPNTIAYTGGGNCSVSVRRKYWN
jgi:hypothetical protein